jgi:hypothetical protein
MLFWNPEFMLIADSKASDFRTRCWSEENDLESQQIKDRSYHQQRPACLGGQAQGSDRGGGEADG